MEQQPGRSQLPIIFLTVFIDLIGFSIIFPLFPDMLEHYLEREGGEGMLAGLLDFLRSASGATGDQGDFYTQVLFGGFLGSLFSVLQFIFAPIWGRLSDRVGRRPVLLITIGGIAASYLLWFFSGSFLLLVLSRVLGGVMSGNISVATAAIADSTDEANRARGMGAIGAAFGLGFILGPALGGGLHALEEATGFSDAASFIPGVNPFSLAAAGAFILSLLNLIWVRKKLSETLDIESRSRARSTRSSNPLKLLHRFPHRGVNLTNVVYFVFLLAFAGMEFTLTFLVKDRFDYTPLGNAGMFVFVGLIIALVQGGVVRRVAPRFGEKRVAIGGLVLVIPGLLLTGLCESQAVLYSGLMLLAVGSALAMPTLTALVSLYTPKHEQGAVLGVFRSLGALSRAIGPIAAAMAYWKFGSQWPYLGGALVILVPILIAFLLPKVEEKR